jgi:polyhydroxybutyrate depolymerase
MQAMMMIKKQGNKFVLLTALVMIGMLINSACESQTAIPGTSTSNPSITPSEAPTKTATVEPTATQAPATSTLEPATENIEKYQEPGDYTVEISVYGIERSFLLHVPPGYQPGEPTPLVFNLHGYSGNASAQANDTHMNYAADQEGFIAVYPQALHHPPTWLGPVPGPAGEADVLFFKELVRYLKREMSIDPDRIYTSGTSNGATMTNHLGCVMSDVFAAIAPVAGGHIAYDACQIIRPVSVVAFHGTDDDVIPYEGDDSGVPSVHDWMEAWAERNGCDPSPTESQTHSEVTKETWQNCDQGVEVTLYTIDGGRHEWPGTGYGPGPYPEGLEPPIYATDVMWDFFDAHPKPPRIATANSGETTEKIIKPYDAPGDYLDMLSVSGYERWFTIHIPPGYQPDTPMPLVINVHPYASTMFEVEEFSKMNAKANEEGFVVVNPQAIGDPPSWWGPLPGIPGQADKDFFVELLNYLQKAINIDPNRIYATGLSNGGTMTNALGCFMSDTFAAIAPVAGGHTDFTNCEIDQPLSVLVIHGTEDPTIPYEGRDNEVPPVHLWVEHWAMRNGCDLSSEITHPESDVDQETWNGCDQDVIVTLYSRIGGGHVWPGSDWAAVMEGSQASINATDLVWEFFKSHPRGGVSTGTIQPTTTVRVRMRPVSFKTEDEVKLSGTLFGEGQIGVILTHMGTIGSSQTSWYDFAERIGVKDFTALPFDFRGVGESQGQVDRALHIYDVRAAIMYLQKKGFEQIICMGASQGGTACLKAATEGELAGVVVIASPFGTGSPTSVEPEELATLTIPKLFICAEKDRNEALVDYTKEMYDASPEPKEIVILEGASAHGTELFRSTIGEEFTKLLITFLEQFTQ